MTSRPISIWKPSPNFNDRPSAEILCIVLHSTATKGIDSPIEWLTSPQSKVSAHYLIGVDGKIVYLVHESKKAWHAGKSEWFGKKNVNDFSVGIELVNANDGIMLYSQDQLDACADLCAEICKEYELTADCIAGHNQIAPGRKTDPMAFPWTDFKNMMHERGIS